ncbi:MAG: protein arginine kinase [Parachlamydiaceae bacterium]
MKNTSFKEILAQYTIPWNDNSNTVWLASALMMQRNIEKYHFPGKLDVDRRKQIVSVIGSEVGKLEGIEQPLLVKAEESSPQEKEFLMEHCLTTESFQQAHQGEAFIVDKSGTYILTVNIRDHLHLRTIDTKGELEGAWNRLVKLETQLSKSFSYAYSSKFGFLTADPFQCGTGLFVSCYLQLSGLIHSGKLQSTIDSMKEDGIHISDLQGDSSELIGDIIRVSNNYTLGINEEAIIASLRNFVTKLIVEENSARSSIKQQESAEIKDKVARSFGLLIHSYQLEAAEALNEIALLKLGLELGWLKGIEMAELNKLFFICRRAHLLNYFPDKISQEEIPHKRAEFIHSFLKNAALTI